MNRFGAVLYMVTLLETVTLAVVIGIVFSIVAVFGGRGTHHFRNRWPAISDEEFLAKCSPGTNPRRALKVRRIISEQLGIPYEHIHPEQHFVEDLDC